MTMKTITKFFSVMCIASDLCAVCTINSDSQKLNLADSNASVCFSVTAKNYMKTLVNIEVLRKVEVNGTVTWEKDDESFSYLPQFAVYNGCIERVNLKWLGNSYFDDNRSKPQEFQVRFLVKHLDANGREVKAETFSKIVTASVM